MTLGSSSPATSNVDSLRPFVNNTQEWHLGLTINPYNEARLLECHNSELSMEKIGYATLFFLITVFEGYSLLF